MSWPLGRRVAVLLGVVLAFAAAILVLGWLSFERLLDARTDVVDQADPAAIAAKEVYNGYLNMESAVTSYVLTGREDVLTPYETGLAQARAAAAELEELAAELPVVEAEAARLVAEGEQWRTEVAAPAIAAVPAPAAEDAVAVGEAQFEQFRASYERLEAALEEVRDDARQGLGDSTRSLVTLLVVAAAVLVALVAATWAALHSWVLEPLRRIGRESRLVAAGNLDHRIEGSGAPEFVELAEDAEGMRRRIVAELEVARAAQAELDDKARELGRSNAELEQFAYVASHDLQEPLRKVASFCELLRRRYAGQLDERADQYIDFAVDGAKRMQVLINDLLAFSRVGRLSEGDANVDLGEALDAARSHVGLALEESGATVRVVGELPTVHGDGSLLVMLFKNLIENAVKFRSEEPPVIEIEAWEGDGQWCFRMSDNGIGIEPEYRDKVFVIFQRLHSRERYPGTGIGLAMCRKIVEYHGGHMWIEDRGDGARGTTFRWTLAPRRQEQAA